MAKCPSCFPTNSVKACRKQNIIKRTYLGEVELQRVISRQRDEQATSEVLRQWIAMIVEKQRVVAERRHCNADPCQVVEVLQHWHLCITCIMDDT